MFPFYIYSLIVWFFCFLLFHIHKPKFYQKKLRYIFPPYFRSYIFLAVFFLIGDKNFPINADLRKFIYIHLGLYIIGSLLGIMVYASLSKKSRKTSQREHMPAIYPQKKLDDLAEIDLSDFDIAKSISKELPKELITKLLQLKSVNNQGSEGIQIQSIKQTWNSRLYNKLKFIFVAGYLNEIWDLNIVFAQLYTQLKAGGYAIVRYIPQNIVAESAYSKKGRRAGRFKLFIFFLLHRCWPKIPIINQSYRLITRGKRKCISKIEIWGRLAYAGFEVKNEIIHAGVSYLLAQKVYTPSQEKNPSYYPLIKLDRVGLYGNIIKVYKLRSMSPYSEFLQQKVFEEKNLIHTGKIAQDYRVTEIGGFLRKYWIDEIPQLLNWLRGNIKLVGIRALSRHYFSLYPRKYKDLYIQVKPGIISPLFDDKTQDFDDIVRIEKDYLISYLKNPIKTDVTYFFKTFSQILRGVRSS